MPKSDDGRPPTNPPTSPVALELLEDRRMLSGQSLRKPDDYLSEHLTQADVEQILAAAASQALPEQMIYVVDREGVILGGLRMNNAPTKAKPRDRIAGKAIARARTAAFFESTQDAFTTRTARFIIQDHFPHPVQNTPGGPLYGVEFSSLPGTDVLMPNQKTLPRRAVPLNISGDPGGIPLYKNGIPVGGIGVAGDGHDVAVRRDLRDTLNDPENPDREFYNGAEEHDFDEAVALSGAKAFMAPERIRATEIFLGGLRFPFTFDQAADDSPGLTFTQVTDPADGIAAVLRATRTSPDPIYPNATFEGITGQLKNTFKASLGKGFGTMSSPLPDAVKLLKTDVNTIIAQAVREAKVIRAAIREPQGVPARVHICVVDKAGNLLGAFREGDGTNFSYDVAVQKARTAVYFSDNSHALSDTAVGFLAQGGGLPPGIADSEPGPLYKIQNDLSLRPGNLKGVIRNGITIFPGGIPLYKAGKLVGGIGISGDGVEQDSIIAFFGGKGYNAPKAIQVDALPHSEVEAFLTRRIHRIITDFDISDEVSLFATRRIRQGLDGTRIPYLKFARNMEL